MGNAVSQPVLQEYLKLLNEFAGQQQADPSDQLWRQLFAFPVSLSQLPPKQVEHNITDCCAQLGKCLQEEAHENHEQIDLHAFALKPLPCVTVSNNGRTQNFQILLCKSVYLSRVLFKHLSESLNAVQLAAFSTDAPYTAAEIHPSEYMCFCTWLCNAA